MSINNKDDYEKLAKILYPSIEASGNVYYGQTRKLTMDEILGKNELNFESHIETFKQGDQTYKSYFNWKIGPLKGTIQVKALDNTGKVTLDNFPNTDYFTLLNYDGSTTQIADINKDIHGTVFAKYRISHVENPVANVISSASFTTYESSFYAEYIGLYIADSNLIVADNTYFLFNDDCNFFITRDGNNSYLYIKIISRKVKSYYKDYIDKPFRITNLQNGQTTITLLTGHQDAPNDRFKYNLNSTGWINCNDANNTYINLIHYGDYVELKINADAIDSYMLGISIDNGHPVSISGNILSLYYSNFSTIDYSSNYFDSDFFINAFKNNNSIVDASKLSIPCQLSTNASFAYMFYGCTQLKYPPELPSISVSENCYESMFCGCTSLEYVPDLSHVLELQNGCFNYMFDGCTAIEYPQDVLPAASLPYRCYYHMYSECTSLKRTPLILSKSTSGQQCLANMFDGCTSLKMASIALSALGTITVYHWLYNVSEDGTIFVVPNFNEESSQNHIPQNWTINRIDFTNLTYYNDNNGFYCDEYSSNEPLANSDLVVSGSDCELNGRGILSDETKFNMLEISPLVSNNIEFGKYDSNSGSLNQEVWGIKSFNSPVLFRNGIYGECASLTTYELNSNSISPAIINELNSSSLSAKNLSNGPSLLSSSVIVSTYEEYLSPITLYGAQSSICSIWPTSDIKIGYINTNDSSIPNNCAGLFNNISGADIMGNYEKEFVSILAVKGSTSNAYIKLHTDTDSNRSSITAAANVVTINSLENINLNIGASVVIPLDDSLIDEDDFQSEQDCVIIGNTRNENSGALVINTHYGYDIGMTIEDTIPITSVCSLTSQLKDENGDELQKCFMEFRCYRSDSAIDLKAKRIDIYGNCNITGNLRLYNGGAYETGVAKMLLPGEDEDSNPELKKGSMALVILDSPIGYFSSQLYAGYIIKRGTDIYEDGVIIVHGIQDLDIYFAEIDNQGNFTKGYQMSIDENYRFALLSQLGTYPAGGAALVMRIE